jgi:hypothetical protein
LRLSGTTPTSLPITWSVSCPILLVGRS